MGDAESLLTTNGVPEAASEAPETAKKISDIVPGGICETKLLEERYENGELKKMEKTPNTVKPEMQHESYALVSTQSFDKYHKPDKTSLEINSPQLLRALKEVIKYYPGQPLIFESQAKIESPFAILYHHMQELEEYRTSATDEIAKKHVKLLLDYLDSGTGAEARKLASRGFTTFPLLWSIFKPGELLFKIENGHKRLYWLEKSAYEKGYFQGEYFQLNCLYTTYDGTQDGKAREDLKIYQQAECPSTNALEIIALSVIPLKYHPDPEGVKIEMSERGKRHEKLQGLHVMLYDGIFMCLKMPPYTHYGNAGSFEGVWLPHTVSLAENCINCPPVPR
jgi:hypothetical protein